MAPSPQSARWTFTVNNWNEDTCSSLAALVPAPAKYVAYGKEVAPTTGTPHLQGYVVFVSNKRLPAVKKLLPTAHWEAAKGTTEQNITYCSKDGQFTEHGDPPKTRKEVGKDNHDKWLDVIRSAEEGTCKAEYPQEYVRYQNTILRMYEPKLENLESYSGLWLYGAPGTGKSRFAHANYPNAYKKMINKWWDNYEHQEEVILDDFGKKHDVLGYHLKIWTDHYPFRGEYKGGSKMIRPKTIVVTSNYTIREIFGDDEQMTLALERRFKVHKFYAPFN